VTPNISGLAAALNEAERGRGSAELKLQVLRIVLAGEPWPKGEQPLQDVLLLISLRNAIVHMKLDMREGDDSSKDAGEPPSLIDRLRPKQILADDRDSNQETWFVVISTRAAARWACAAVAAMVQSIISLLPPSDFSDDARRFLGGFKSPAAYSKVVHPRDCATGGAAR
jgi:hypothetical protein